MRFIFLLSLLFYGLNALAVPTRQAIDAPEDEEISGARTAKFLSTDYDSFIQDVEAYAPQTEEGEKLLEHLLVSPVDPFDEEFMLGSSQIGYYLSQNVPSNPSLNASLGYYNYLPPNYIKEMLFSVGMSLKTVTRLLEDLRPIQNILKTVHQAALDLSCPMSDAEAHTFKNFLESTTKDHQDAWQKTLGHKATSYNSQEPGMFSQRISLYASDISISAPSLEGLGLSTYTELFAPIFKPFDSRDAFSAALKPLQERLISLISIIREITETDLTAKKSILTFYERWQTAHARLYVKLKESPYGDNVGVQMLEQMILDTSFWGMRVTHILSLLDTARKDNLSQNERLKKEAVLSSLSSAIHTIAHNNPLLDTWSGDFFLETHEGSYVGKEMPIDVGGKTHAIKLFYFFK